MVKLSSSLEDMPNLQANNSGLSSQEDVIKYLQAIYGKNSAEILQKLPPLNDWPLQSVSPPDLPRGVGGVGGACGSNSVMNSCSSIVGSRGASGAASFSNNINDGNSSLQKQDIQFASTQHQATPSAINHHFRVSTTNVHSPQQQQQQLSQQKSVLSLHQHHQTDSSNRRLSHHHNLSATNASFANLNAAAAAAAMNASTSSSSSLNDNILNALSNISGKNTSNSFANPTIAPNSNQNIMDTMGSPLDNILYDGSMQQNTIVNKDNSTSQQSLIRHQHLQKLLKSTGSHSKTSPSSLHNFPHRSDPQLQRNIPLNNSVSQIQRQLTPPVLAISPPQPPTNLPSVPKSLLNLAACSSNASNSCNAASSVGARQRNAIQNLSARLASMNQQAVSQSNGSITVSNNRAPIRGGSNDNSVKNTFSQRGTNGIESGSSLQQLTRALPVHATGPTNSSLKKQLQLSLLSDDQTPTSNRVSTRSTISSSGVVRGQSSHNVPGSQANDNDLSGLYNALNSREALANLQERAAKVGVSIGETTISKQQIPQALENSSPSNLKSRTTPNPLAAIQQVSATAPKNQSKEVLAEPYDRKEIESALSRVEARNDLSLLYPPMLLSSTSQRQLNALAARLQESNDAECSTDEVRKIVLEECNIIYECKQCNNLFRSLANLVKHKRTFCTEHSSERVSFEMNRRSNMTSITPLMSQSATTNIQSSSLSCDRTDPEQDEDRGMSEGLSEVNLLSPRESSGSSKYNLRVRRQNNDLKAFRILRGPDSKDYRDTLTTRKQSVQSSVTHYGMNVSPSTQTSLSKLLQSQPKNRLPVNRDSALLGALNMRSLGATVNSSVGLDARSSVGAVNSSNDLNERLVRNSSLAKTLLSENVRSANSEHSPMNLYKIDTDSNGPVVQKQAAPKRKFLEDCIRKVKRDKLRTDDEEDINQTLGDSMTHSGGRGTNTACIQSDLDQGESAALEESSDGTDGEDPNKLVIDLDTANSSTSSSQRSSSKPTPVRRRSSLMAGVIAEYNRHSALLKALTRPVDAKPSYSLPSSQSSTENKTIETVDQEVPSNTEDTAEEQAQSDPHPNDDESETIQILSPLFDKYTCDICQEDLADQAQLMDHTMKIHTKEKMIYPCIFCSFSFIMLENVCRHILEIHKKSKTQVQRLQGVVRSRSFVTNDFMGCADASIIMKEKLKPDNNEEIESEALGGTIDSKSIEIGPVGVASGTEERDTTVGFIDSSEPHSSASSTDPTAIDLESAHSSPEPNTAKDSSLCGPARRNSSTNTPGTSDSIIGDRGSVGSDTAEPEQFQQSDVQSSVSNDENLEEYEENPTLNDDNDDGEDDDNYEDDEDNSCQEEQSSPRSFSETKFHAHRGSGKHLKMDQDPTEQYEDDDDESDLSDSDALRTYDDVHSENDDEDYERDEEPQEISAKPNPSKTPQQTTPPSNSAGSSTTGGGGGIMKLKIQLKTQPDEKSKIYRIV